MTCLTFYMDRKNAGLLLEKFKAGTISDDELAMLESWYIHEIKTNKDYRGLDENIALLDQKFSFITGGQPARYKSNPWKKIAVAASVIACLGTGAYLYRHAAVKPAQMAQNKKQDIEPGGNKAILTLSDGRQVAVNNRKTGLIANQGSVTVNKENDEALVYEASSAGGKNEMVAYNTLTVPRGGQQPVVLADGTHVWLNSASSLKYPVSFKGKERLVVLTGEAYFEVAYNPAMPFKVTTLSPLGDGKDQTVEVLGTHFNINSYADEPYTAVTLLAGSIKLGTPSETKILKPGQQARMTVGGNSSALQISNVDTEDAIAWKEGLFIFDDAETLQSIMRKVSRWYNAEVEFADPELKKKPFSGSFPRSGNISQVLKKIELTKAASFTVSAHKIIITKYTGK